MGYFLRDLLIHAAARSKGPCKGQQSWRTQLTPSATTSQLRGAFISPKNFFNTIWVVLPSFFFFFNSVSKTCLLKHSLKMTTFLHPAPSQQPAQRVRLPWCAERSQLSLEHSQQGRVLRQFHGGIKLFSLSNVGKVEKFVRCYTGSPAAPLAGGDTQGTAPGRPSFTRSTATLRSARVLRLRSSCRLLRNSWVLLPWGSVFSKQYEGSRLKLPRVG